MSVDSILPESSDNGVCEGEHRTENLSEKTNAAGDYPFEGGQANQENVEQILPVKDSEILPFTLCESVLPEKEVDTVCENNSKERGKQKNAEHSFESFQAEKGSGIYTINNYIYEREKQKFYSSTGETVMYLRCTKARKHGCKKARAVLVIDGEGTVKVRKCAENEEHTHPPPVEDVLRKNVKMKLKAMIRSHPEKSMRELYNEIVKEEYDSYTEVDPDLSRLLPSYDGVRSFIHRERAHLKQEEEVKLALTERGEPPLEQGKALRKKWKRLENCSRDKTVEGSGKKRIRSYSKEIIYVDHSAKSNQPEINAMQIKKELDSSREACDGYYEEIGQTIKALPDTLDGGSILETILDTTQSSSPATLSSSTEVEKYSDPRNKKPRTSLQRGSGETNGHPSPEMNNSYSLTPVIAGDPSTYAMAHGEQPSYTLVQPNSHSRYDLLGKNWAEKMKTLRSDQRIFAEKLINDVFYEAEWCRLSHGCSIHNSG